jgi:hypothetical protein
MSSFCIIVDTSGSMSLYGKISIVNSVISYLEMEKQKGKFSLSYYQWNDKVKPIDLDTYQGVLKCIGKTNASSLFSFISKSKADYFALLSDGPLKYSDFKELKLTLKDKLIYIPIGCDANLYTKKLFKDDDSCIPPESIYKLISKKSKSNILPKKIIHEAIEHLNEDAING